MPFACPIRSRVASAICRLSCSRRPAMATAACAASIRAVSSSTRPNAARLGGVEVERAEAVGSNEQLHREHRQHALPPCGGCEPRPALLGGQIVAAYRLVFSGRLHARPLAGLVLQAIDGSD